MPGRRGVELGQVVITRDAAALPVELETEVSRCLARPANLVARCGFHGEMEISYAQQNPEILALP